MTSGPCGQSYLVGGGSNSLTENHIDDPASRKQGPNRAIRFGRLTHVCHHCIILVRMVLGSASMTAIVSGGSKIFILLEFCVFNSRGFPLHRVVISLHGSSQLVCESTPRAVLV